MQTEQRWRGLILGTAVGDSLGLVAEGISRRRNAKLFHQHWRQRFFLRWGECVVMIPNTRFFWLRRYNLLLCF